MSDAQRRAVELARFYFRRVAEEAGASWDGDNDVEIELMTGNVIDAAVERLRPALDDAIKRIRLLEDGLRDALNRLHVLEDLQPDYVGYADEADEERALELAREDGDYDDCEPTL